MRTRRTLAGALLALTMLGPATGAAGQDATPPIPERRVFLVTLGPGAAVWERFGHNALWIHDPARGTDIAYHYGLFDMSESGFLTRFLQGRMAYSMGSADALALIDAYRRMGRDASVMELRLTQAQIDALQEFLTWNLRPENRVYRYDYFRDNCSTRIRDALDRVLGGSVRDALESEPTPITYRSEALSLITDDRPLTAGMDLGLGPLADQPITRWDLAFIPMRLRDDLRSLEVSTPEGPQPLVMDERVLPAVGAPDPEAGAVPRVERSPGVTAGRLLGMLLLGALVGAAMAGAGWLAGDARRGSGTRVAGRWTLGLLGGGWGLLAGVLGLILLALWTLTDHEFAHANENLLQANPLALGLAVLAPVAAIRGGSRTATLLAALLAALSVVGLLLHPLPVTRQSNLAIIALALPIHVGLLLGLGRLDRS